LPNPAISDQAAEIDFRQASSLAQELVAGLESSPGQDVRISLHGKDTIVKKKLIKTRRHKFGGKNGKFTQIKS
jgi:hypothetical protein